MAVIYVDGLLGNDGNSGLSPGLAKATISGSRAAYTGGQDLVLVRPMVYPEPNITWNAVNDDNVLIRNNPAFAGVPIIDFVERLDYLTAANATNAYWSVSRSTKFLNLEFRNMAATACAIKGNHADHWVLHCVFHSQNVAITGIGLGSPDETTGNTILVRNCSFYNLVNPFRLRTGSVINNCYAKTFTAFNPLAGATQDYNAYLANAEANGINTATTDPGFRQAAALDFRLDPFTIPADYVTYMNAGLDGGRIGAFGRGGIYYHNGIPQLRYFTADPTPGAGNPNPSWENEGPAGTNTYLDGTPGNVIEDPTTKELILDATGSPTGGRVRSPVFDTGVGSNRIESLVLAGFEDLSGGAAFDTDVTLPQRIEYRSSAIAFLIGAATPAWIPVARGAFINRTHRFHQVRIEYQAVHTNL